MKSHTVPKKLLEQFAYHDATTSSPRLWRYEKGRAPFGKARPKGATVVAGHFADPRNPAREHEIEQRLAREIQEPVNEFIEMLRFETFVLSPAHIRKLTAYISLLFTRSRARQVATEDHVQIKIESMRKLLENEDQLSQIAAKWTIDLIEDGQKLDKPVPVEEVIARLTEAIDQHLLDDQVQHDYSGAVERMMTQLDPLMADGAWGFVRTTPNEPFVIGDAPVIPWERTSGNRLRYGIGFARPNVEVVFPVSPTACIHILPAVNRTSQPIIPSTQDINKAQAAFAVSTDSPMF